MTATTATDASASPIPQSIGDLARALGVPSWRVRRVVDELAGKSCPRIGPFRVVPPDLAERVRLELVRLGFLDGGPPDAA